VKSFFIKKVFLTEEFKSKIKQQNMHLTCQIGIAGAIAFRDEHRKRSCSWDLKEWYLRIESKTNISSAYNGCGDNQLANFLQEEVSNFNLQNNTQAVQQHMLQDHVLVETHYIILNSC
jgi:hypothetical protein